MKLTVLDIVNDYVTDLEFRETLLNFLKSSGNDKWKILNFVTENQSKIRPGFLRALMDEGTYLSKSSLKNA